jgi:hypothetical protein
VGSIRPFFGRFTLNRAHSRRRSDIHLLRERIASCHSINSSAARIESWLTTAYPSLPFSSQPSAAVVTTATRSAISPSLARLILSWSTHASFIAMVSPVTKHARDVVPLGRRVGKGLKVVLKFVFTIVCTLIVTHYVVRGLPGPNIEVVFGGLRSVSGENAGCIDYTFYLNTDQEIENAYLKLQFLNTITDSKVGLTSEAQTIAAGRTGIGLFEAGRNPGGECGITQSTTNGAKVTSVVSGNMWSVYLEKLPAHTSVTGMAATAEFQPSVKPAIAYTEGYYEYSVLGQTVRKPLKFIDNGVPVVRSK